MARKIIVLNSQLQSDGTTTLSYVYWLTVPATLQAANPSATSLVANATTAELTSLQNGSVKELSYSVTLSPGFVQAEVGTILVRGFNQVQVLLTNQGAAKQYANASWDGTTWSNLPA